MLNPLILDRKSRVPKSQLHHMVNDALQNMIFEYHDIQLRLQNQIDEVAECLSQQYQNDKNPQILNMKRDIFNKRILKIKNGLLKYQYPKCHEDTINEIVKILENQKNLFQSIEVKYEEQVNKERVDLQNAYRNYKDLSNPILLWNMDIYHKLTKYMNTPCSEHGNDLRKIDYTLMKALSRTCMKTSPFSTFTKVGQAVTGDDAFVNGKDLIKTKINYTFLYKIIFNMLEKEDKFYKSAEYVLSPHAFVEKNGKRMISYVAHVDKIDSQKVYKTSEVLYEINVIPALENLFKNKTLKDSITFEEIHEMLCSVASQNTEDTTLRFTKKYVEVGLLNYRIGFREEANDLIGEILETIEKYMTEETFQELSDVLNSFNENVRKLESVKNFKEKYDGMRTIEEIGIKLCTLAGVSFNRRNFFYEDGICTEISNLPQKVMLKNIDNMRLLQEFALIFDINLRLKYELGERIFNKYGVSASKMDSSFFQIVFEVSKDMGIYWTGPLETFEGAKSEVVKLMDRLKIKFYEELNDLQKKVSSDDEIDISDLIKKYVNMIPQDIKKSADISTAYFFQINKDKLIINGVYEGQEKFKARFLDYFNKGTSTEAYRKYVEEYYEFQNYYEFLDSFGFNGNIKTLTLNKECVTLGTGMRRFIENSDNEKLVFEDCLVKVTSGYHGIEFFDQKCKKIKVVMRGSLVPTAMPGYFSFISQLFVTGKMLFKMSDLIEAPQIQRFTMGDLILSRKRLRLSDHIAFLKREEKESDMAYFIRINMYFKKSKLPNQFFITFKRNKETMGDVIQNFKPLYVDIRNIMLLKIFEKEVIEKNYTTNFFIEECLSNSGEYVEEFEVEISKREGMCRAI